MRTRACLLTRRRRERRFEPIWQGGGATTCSAAHRATPTQPDRERNAAQQAGSKQTRPGGLAALAAAALVVSTAWPAAGAPIPDTQIDAGSTPDTAQILPTEQAIFYFSAVGAPADSFECRVDGATFSACTSPMTYQLATGSHLFEVRAKAGGDADATPALSQWIVRNVPCEQATADYNAARSSFFKHHTRLGYTKEKLQRAKDAGNQALIEKYTRKKRKLQRQIKADQAAMDAAKTQQDAVC